MKMKIAQKTHVGFERHENQDDMGYFNLAEGKLFIVADGMGGESGGREAARMAVFTISETFKASKTEMPARLESAIIHANQDIYEKGVSGDSKYHRMGTTVVVLVIDKLQAYTGHVGDSRIYRFRKGRLERLTRDHSRLQQMLDDGIISPAEAEGHPDAHIINRALGARQDVVPEISDAPLTVLPGDLFMLCTDGLCGLVEDRELGDLLRCGGTLKTLCDRLVSAALEKGGHDNVTVQLVLFEEAKPLSEAPCKKDEIFETRSRFGSRALFLLIFLLLGLTAAIWFLLQQMVGG